MDSRINDVFWNMNPEMEELGEITKAHYRAGSQRVKDLAYDFFKSMDTDGDDQVDRSEFLAFMRQQGCYPYMQNPSFFNKLDVDGSGTLEFFEVMTLYYIMKSGRPFCDMCGQFITGIFFSCVQCFKNPQTSYNLCLDCYSGEKKCNHTHNGRSQFLDNFVFLQAMRDPKLAHALEVNFNEVMRYISSNIYIDIFFIILAFSTQILDNWYLMFQNKFIYFANFYNR